jgi:hypothetical protein
MINIENQVYTLIRSAIQPYSAEIGSIYTESPSKFPYVFFTMTNNLVFERGSDSGDIENFANQNFEVNIYTNSDDKKSLANSIADTIDTKLKSLGFRRVFYSTVPNFRDNNIYRLILRYRVIVGKDNTTYYV